MASAFASSLLLASSITLESWLGNDDAVAWWLGNDDAVAMPDNEAVDIAGVFAMLTAAITASTCSPVTSPVTAPGFEALTGASDPTGTNESLSSRRLTRVPKTCTVYRLRSPPS